MKKHDTLSTFVNTLPSSPTRKKAISSSNSTNNNNNNNNSGSSSSSGSKGGGGNKSANETTATTTTTTTTPSPKKAAATTTTTALPSANNKKKASPKDSVPANQPKITDHLKVQLRSRTKSASAKAGTASTTSTHAIVSDAELALAAQRVQQLTALQACPWKLTIRTSDTKGRCVHSSEDVIPKGSFVCEYAGEYVSEEVGRQREAKYAAQNQEESYIYYLTHSGRTWCIDATADTMDHGYGRLINHSRLHPNLSTRKIIVDKQPRLVFFALRDILRSEELLYDYGDRRSSLDWMNNS